MEDSFQTIKGVINHDFFFNNLSNRVRDIVDFWKLSSITQFLEIFLFLFIIIKYQKVSFVSDDLKLDTIPTTLVIWGLVSILFAIVNVIDIYKSIMTTFAINRVMSITMVEEDKMKLNELRITLFAILASLLTQIVINKTIVPFAGITSFVIKGLFYKKSLQLRKVNLIS